ncbi:MAG TPA: RNA polymerase sigma factor [Bryobacteraceae bacterium]|nr:RNA polymerase sigma factor [Bryobacteraceae bacterium]
MEPALLAEQVEAERVEADEAVLSLDRWMGRYQEGDPNAPGVLIAAISPGLLRFFRSQPVSREQADDLLQDTWLRIHRVRHTYRPGEPVLPWVYAIARRARVDGYRREMRIAAHEKPTRPDEAGPGTDPPRHEAPAFETLIAALPASQREVITLLKVSDLTLEEVARATSSTVGAVKQKAHRAYKRLRELLQPEEKSLP